MNYRMYALVAVFVSGCASMVEPPAGVLYGRYSDYREDVTEANMARVAANYFSPTLLEGKDLSSDEIVGQLLFKHYMANEVAHHEKSDARTGCLTVNGFDEAQEPLAFNIAYVRHRDAWLIDDINVMFVGSRDGFSDSPRCPHEVVNAHD